MTNKAHHFNALIELVLMMYIYYISFIEKFVRYKGKSENPGIRTNPQTDIRKKSKVKTEGPIVFVSYALFSILFWRSSSMI